MQWFLGNFLIKKKLYKKSKLKYFVEKNENSDEIYECVISIPGSFGVSEIISILEASKIAELNVLGIINDATSGIKINGI